jgi:hypothetical protein
MWARRAWSRARASIHAFWSCIALLYSYPCQENRRKTRKTRENRQFALQARPVISLARGVSDCVSASIFSIMATGEQCALCLEVKALVNSHYIPAFCYRDLWERSGLRHPVLVTEKISVLRAKQLQHPLLCKDCEDRFNRGGERWVADQSARSPGSFPLRSLLRRQPPHSFWEGDPVYFAEFILPARVESLIYFAASVFWRGAIYDWARLGSNSKQ